MLVNLAQELKQGSSLSPMLFALYITSLGQQLQNSKLGVPLGGVLWKRLTAETSHQGNASKKRILKTNSMSSSLIKKNILKIIFALI